MNQSPWMTLVPSFVFDRAGELLIVFALEAT